MTKKKSKLPITVGIACVWFGAHCGPGTASGVQTKVYYNVFGQAGLITPFIAMALLGLCIYLSIEFARLTKVDNFKSWANKFFFPYNKLFANLFECAYIFTVLMVVGSCIATGATLLEQYFGLPMILGTLIIAGLTLFLSIFGANLVRSSSTVMTIVIVIAIGIIIFAALGSSKGNFTSNYAETEFATPSLWAAIWSSIIYAGFQASGNIANSVSVAKGLKSHKESVIAACIGFLLNTVLIIGVAAMLFAFPQALLEELPNYYVAEQLGSKLLLLLYVVILVLAVLTTTVGFSFAVTARYSPLIKKMKNGPKKDALISCIMLILCIGVSTFGLTKIVKVGFGYLGLVSVFVVIIPVIIIGFIKNKKLRAEQ